MGGGVGVRVLSTVVITLPPLSCRSFYGPCVGIASVNHVDHPRADLYFRRQPARRDFRIGKGQYLLLARSCSVAGLVTSSASKLVVFHAKTAPRSALVVSSTSTSGNFQDLARDFVRCGSAPNLVPPKLSELSGETVGSKFPFSGPSPV